MKKALVVLAILGAIALPISKAHAACGFSVPMVHLLDSFFACDNSRGSVSAFAYQVSAPLAINSGTDIITLVPDPGPGMVRIATDWADTGVLGCPNDAAGNHRLMIVVQANDGTGLLASISGADPGTGYQVENAHTFDALGGAVLPLPCGNLNGRPFVLGATATDVTIRVQPPHIFSDCDPDSVFVAGLGLACPDGFDTTAAAAAIGGIYTDVQPCGTKPDVRKAGWTATGLIPSPTGDATVPYTKPASDTDCFYIGTTTTVGGLESDSINGFIQVQGGLAAPPTAENVRAAMETGKVKLSWSTSNEVGLAGFRLIAVSKTKGQFEIGSLVAAKGTPSSYTAEVRMGDLKGARSIIIRSVLSDGTTVDAAPVNF